MESGSTGSPPGGPAGRGGLRAKLEEGLLADRVIKAAELSVEEPEARLYLVTGGRDAHWVNLRDRTSPRCDCGDYLWKENVCKHLIAVLAHRRDPHLLRQLAKMGA